MSISTDILRFRLRRELRRQHRDYRQDGDGWITLKDSGVHVLIDNTGRILFGPESLRGKVYKKAKSDPRPFSKDRKKAAKSFTGKQYKKADAYYDPIGQQAHANMTSTEEDAFWAYTGGSGGFNRPLAGFKTPYKYMGSAGWDEQYNRGTENVSIDNEGKGWAVRALTDAINRSSYPDDVSLRSFQDPSTVEGFLNLPKGSLSTMSGEKLKNFVGMSNRMNAFISTSIEKGGVSPFNQKDVVVDIFCPSGSKMLYVTHGAYGKKEHEMILQRGASYTITGIRKTKGKIHVQMELHNEKGYHLFQQNPKDPVGYMGK